MQEKRPHTTHSTPLTAHPYIQLQKGSKGSRCVYEGWEKCPFCKRAVSRLLVQQNFSCCTTCQAPWPLMAKEWTTFLLDAESFQEQEGELPNVDPLHFCDKFTYQERLQRAQKATGRKDAVLVGTGRLHKRPIALCIFDFRCMGGSMGLVEGEKIARIAEYAQQRKIGLLTITASGGARMQESIFSLMQMAKVVGALQQLQKAQCPHIVLLSHPTTGGVLASLGTQATVILAEPKALIGFTGPRVLEKSLGQKLSQGVQRAEHLQERGYIDQVVPRPELRSKLQFFFDFLS